MRELLSPRLALTLLLAAALGVSCAGPEVLPTQTDEWEGTLDRVANGVVALRVNVPRAFDTEGSGSFLGTGFVVDLEAGLILTNRHLVQPGPVVAEAILLNHEEIDLWPVYRDPIHDFGLFRFDPEAVRYMDLTELELAPEAARVGMEIRVIGNDAGEKLSILGATLARLDRPAPEYGDEGYNDFNTFYFQAASDTSGGSSGSPVVGVDGRVVGLNAGGAFYASSSFYLPLDRVVRAIELVKQGQPVTRGTIGTVFHHTPFDELRRLGLSEATEATIRETLPDEHGMLVVDQVVPGSPGSENLEPGDIVVRANGELLTRFVPLDDLLDSSVGTSIVLTIERGGTLEDVELTVGDLHAVSPSEYVELGGGVVHELSYQQARNNHIPVSGIYVARSGYMLGDGGLSEGTIIQSFDGQPVTDLDHFWEVAAAIPDGKRVAIRFVDILSPWEDHVTVVTMDRTWHSMQRCARDDSAGTWPCERAPEPPSAEPQEVASTRFTTGGAGPTPILAPSLVVVEYRIPYRVEGVWGGSFTGGGLIVDAERGLVVVDRDTVPVGLGDVKVIFGGSLRVPGRVVFIHPLHNFAVVAYDPADIGDTPVEAAEIRATDLSQGDDVWLVGLGADYQLASRQTQVENQNPLVLPFPSSRPQFRDVNIEAISVEDVISTLGGVLADDRGRVLALWASFHVSGYDTLLGLSDDGLFLGIPSELLEMVLEPLRAGESPNFRALGIELGTTPLANARDLGLSDEWADALEAHNPRRRQALTVTRLFAGFEAADVLQGGDLLIAIDGAPVTRFIEVERASQASTVAVTVVREGQELTFDIPTVALDGDGIDRVLAWSGLLLHAPHLELASQRGIESEGVLVSWLFYGSPGSSSDVRPTHRIIGVNGTPTPDLDAFVLAVEGLEDRQALRLETLDLDGQPHMVTIRLDLQFWPTFELVRTADGWERRE